MKGISTPGTEISMSREEAHKLITEMYQWLGREPYYDAEPKITLSVRLYDGEPNNCSISVGP